MSEGEQVPKDDLGPAPEVADPAEIADSDVQVPLFSRFVFPEIEIPPGEDVGAAVAAVRAKLGGRSQFEITASESERVVRVKALIDFPGRAMLPGGTVAAQQSEWRAIISFPAADSEGGKKDELPAEEVDLSAGEIVERGGHVVVVIPLMWA